MTKPNFKFFDKKLVLKAIAPLLLICGGLTVIAKLIYCKCSKKCGK